jgi:group I intron endonuclease
MIIYLIINTINGRCYVGQTIQPLAKRWHRHVADANAGSKRPMSQAIRKYGRQAFRILQLCECESRLELNRRECEFIKAFRSDERQVGYNRAPGGGIPMIGLRKGQKASEETKAKLRALTGPRSSMFGRKHSEETKRKMREKAMGNKYGVGHSVSDEHRQILSNARATEWKSKSPAVRRKIMKQVRAARGVDTSS